MAGIVTVESSSVKAASYACWIMKPVTGAVALSVQVRFALAGAVPGANACAFRFPRNGCEPLAHDCSPETGV